MEKKYISDIEAKDIICEIGKRMYMKGYVASNDGNISIKCGENEIWVTPTGVSKGFMTPDMMVKLDMDGRIIEGNSKPSSEIKMHLRVYYENSSTMAVVHAHPPVATSFAIAGIALNKPILPEAIVMLGNVPVAPYATPGTQAVPDSIAPYCRDYNAVLLSNHGALTWGSDPMEAYYRLESLEHYSLILMYTSNIIKKANELSIEEISELIEIRTKMGITAGGFPVSEK
jgi:L-fuculose-phosphate aldolase